MPIFYSGVSFKEYFDGAWLILFNSGSHNSVVDRLYQSLDVWLNTTHSNFLDNNSALIFKEICLKIATSLVS
jgi:type III secretory pathway component EscT